MDVQTAKSAIIRELGNRIAVSGGPEVFRRLVGGQVDVVQGALAELVKEGLLKETTLRVGTIYHYPPNVKSSLGVMNAALSGSRVARPVARPAAPAAPARPAAPAAAAPVATTGPVAYTGPVRAKKKSQTIPEELAAATAPPPVAAPIATAAPALAAAPTVHTGPVRAKKKGQMTPDALAAAAAPPASGVVAGTGAAGAASEQEAVAPEQTSAAAVTSADVIEQRPAPADAAPDAPKAYTGPVRARKKSEGG